MATRPGRACREVPVCPTFSRTESCSLESPSVSEAPVKVPGDSAHCPAPLQTAAALPGCWNDTKSGAKQTVSWPTLPDPARDSPPQHPSLDQSGTRNFHLKSTQKETLRKPLGPCPLKSALLYCTRFRAPHCKKPNNAPRGFCLQKDATVQPRVFSGKLGHTSETSERASRQGTPDLLRLNLPEDRQGFLDEANYSRQQ